MRAEEIVVGDGARFGESVELVDPLFGDDELHERLFPVLHEFDGPRADRRHQTLLFPVEKHVGLAILHLLRLHFRHVHVVVLVPLSAEKWRRGQIF